MGPSTLHFLLLPFPAQGHINPMLHLASHLVALNCTVTFVNTGRLQLADAAPEDLAPGVDSTTDTVDTSQRDMLRFVTVPNGGQPAGLSSTVSSNNARLRSTLAGMEQQRDLVENLVEDSKATGNPISCVISDFLSCEWVKDLAKRQRIGRVMLWPSNALAFCLGYLGGIGKSVKAEKLALRFELDTAFSGADENQDKEGAEKMRFIWKLFDGAAEASHVLMNTFEHLEGSLLQEMPPNVRFIGPCLPAGFARDNASIATSMAQRGNLFTEDEACLPWLDTQEKCSVLFISFGSEGSLPQAQVQELALGIEASHHKFLWVFRPDAPADNQPPEDFQQRTKDRGMIISWAPQLRVLGHPSIGGFLTHCGWNSTLESIFMGVPMLCFPLSADQPLNAQLIDKQWHVGMRFSKGQDGMVARTDVERVVRALMDDGGQMRLQAEELKQASKRAAVESRSTLTSFVEDIASRRSQ